MPPPSSIPSTEANPKKSSGVSSGIRVIISVLVAMTLGIMSLFWYYQVYPSSQISWTLDLCVIPGIAVLMSFICNCLIQWLSCGTIQYITQLSRLWMVPVLFYLMTLLLFIFPSLRWPIEGLYQEYSPTFRFGLSSGFYTFWMALYTQAFMNGVAQICPK